MKTFLKNHWPKITITFLILAIILIYINRKWVMENDITKAKMEIFNGILDSDKEKIKNGLDSMKHILGNE